MNESNIMMKFVVKEEFGEGNSIHYFTTHKIGIIEFICINFYFKV